MPRTARLTLFFATAFLTGDALAADPREQQLAQALFDEARQLMEAKRYAEACPKLAESQRLDPGGGTLLNLALCHEKEGKVATAHAEFNEALSLALQGGRKDREELARERLGVLEPKIPRVSVVVPPNAEIEGLEVRLDGLTLRRAAWGVATPVDPGLHHIEALAPGRTSWNLDLPIDVQERKTVQVPPLAPLGALPLVLVETPPAIPAAQPAPPSFTWQPNKPNLVFYTVMGVAAVAFGVSAVTGGMALDANSTAKEGCLAERHFCRDQASIDAADKARTMAWVSTGAFAAGVVGAFALIFIPSRARSLPTPQVGVAPLPGGGAVQVGSGF